MGAGYRISNNGPVYIWILMACWLGFAAAFGYFRLREGIDGERAVIEIVVAAFLLITGIAASRHLLSLPRVSLAIENGIATVHERRPFSRPRKEVVRAKDLAVLDVIADKDSDGDDHFRCVVRLPSGHEVTVSEGVHLTKVETARQLLLAAIADGGRSSMLSR